MSKLQGGGLGRTCVGRRRVLREGVGFFSLCGSAGKWGGGGVFKRGGVFCKLEGGGLISREKVKR